MSRSYHVSLAGPAPWGFRLQGGKDFCMPLTISRLTDEGKAARAKMSVGDVILSINGISTDGTNHLEAQNKIKACTGNLSLTLQRPSSAPKDGVPKDEPQEIIKPVPITHPATSTAYTKPSSQPGAAYNKTARPFGGDSGVITASSPAAPTIPSQSSAFKPAGPSQPPQPPFLLKSSLPATDSPPANSVPRPGPARHTFTSPSASSSSSNSSSPARVTAPSSHPNVPQPSVYNTPINLYSNTNACEAIIGQRRGLLQSQGLSEPFNGKPSVVLEDHASPLSDASKKRLIEDTEDWNSRTGTSQSRSFRILAQLTGTENEPAPENSGKSLAVDKAPPPALHTSPAAKIFSKSAASPRNGNIIPTSTFKSPVAQSKPSFQPGGPPGFPKGGAAPSFGKVTNLPRAPDRPTPQPHPQDLNCVVQRAEHIPAGTRTPMCNKCNNVIRGPFLVAMGMSWHPEEFNCAHCHSSLAENGFVEERGQVYCEHCYEQFFAPTCARCQQKILGEVMNALKQTWHVSCFVCVGCQQPIRGNTFHMEDGQPYCEIDYYKMFGSSCHGCDFPIEAGDKFLDALGSTWHDTCFVCAVCSTSLEGQTFFSKKDKPLCKKHAHTVAI
ncbi:PDZ and LIM domain protein 5b isoform X1 [Pseudoliparis swirei]|uniref:PDZ and LIM domain protein 5b isoform X1 n=1 Tax=Pseudoliparis swirei TaxID=2059687 RepID=UPI0024BD8FAF|nr:PDZ and LIM domain protein 5b isoform X1 [Pseudoliparis swirei]XP_056288129.1 PDZ and LIM domain protein 5b isoform X1 [Pseudoliparis swirei]XP_056288130.1 PDZ and LIM domain protein 5b isoform X1 [Pseudoliparis swirei]